MELFYRFSVVVAIVSTLALSSCTDDVYDPERGIQTKPKENPLGEDFTAPDGFDWSMVNTVNLNVEINDEFDGRYKYLYRQPDIRHKRCPHCGGHCQQERKLQRGNQRLQSRNKTVYPSNRSQATQRSIRIQYP